MYSDALFMFHVCFCYAALPVPGSHVITFCVLSLSNNNGVLGQVWYFIVSIPDLCLTLY